jgi:hypothetical protein
MPWVRIDENALEHPKIAALPDGAFRLWVQGLAHCQKFLTDGFIDDRAVKGLRAYSPKRRSELLTAGLWDHSELGIQVHDYLAWNDSREHVVAARQHARERLKRMREKRRRNGVSPTVSTSVCDAAPLRGVGVSSTGSSVTTPEEGVGETTPADRAGKFAEWYAETHERLFHIGYMGTQKDWQTALQLVEKFTDRQIQDAALVWFGMDDDFATNGTRTIPKFASRISGCLQQIRNRGIA